MASVSRLTAEFQSPTGEAISEPPLGPLVNSPV